VRSGKQGFPMWFCFINGRQEGPFTEEQFQAMIAGGSITLDTQVWKEGQAAWERLAQVRSDLSATDACEVCQRLAGAEHLIELSGVRVCSACKPAVLQRMREGVPAMPPLPRPRPVMVWVISIFYFVFTPLGAIGIFLMPMLASSGIPITDEQRHYFQSQNALDYSLAALGMLLNLGGAILLFRLRRQALACFGGCFALMFVNFGYQIAFKHWLQVIASQPGGFIGAGIGLVFSLGINIALVWYVWHLKETKVLQ
jgi:GYF domain 2